jgi:hypothetical protein
MTDSEGAEVAKRPTALVLRSGLFVCSRKGQEMITSGASHLVSSNLTLSAKKPMEKSIFETNQIASPSFSDLFDRVGLA